MSITIGDLHANAIKLLVILRAFHFTSFTEKQREDFLIAYYENDIVLFENCLKKIKFTANTKKIRFLGDILSDRGRNDWFILKILQQMNNNHIPYEIIYSNHDALFISSINHLKENIPIFVPESPMFMSIWTLSDTLRESNERRKIFIDIVNKCYLPKLQLMSLFTDKHNQIYCCSHAPLKYGIIKKLCEKYHLAEEFFFTHKSVEIINDEFKSGYLKEQIITNGGNFNDQDIEYEFVYNRDLNNSDMMRYPTIKFIHGHSGNGENIYPNEINLDNVNGKLTAEVDESLPDVVEIPEQQES